MADITRADVAGLIQDAYTTNVFESAEKSSAVLAAFPTVSMGTKTHILPVAASAPNAEWVSESGTKPTGKATWVNKNLVAEELAVIIPVHENVLADASEDILAEISRMGGEAIAAALDAAVLFGTNKPLTWTSKSLFEAATASGQLFQVGTGENDLAGSIFQAAGAISDNGRDASDIFTAAGLKFKLANLRDGNGAMLLSDGGFGGLNSHFVKGTIGNDAPVFVRDSATGLVVDASRVRIGIRQDITVKFLDQATVGGINLAERDMVALRFVARFGYVLADENAVSAVTPAVVTP